MPKWIGVAAGALLVVAAVVTGWFLWHADKNVGAGWVMVDKTPIGEYVYKKHFDAEKITIYCYGQFSISVVRD